MFFVLLDVVVGEIYILGCIGFIFFIFFFEFFIDDFVGGFSCVGGWKFFFLLFIVIVGCVKFDI